MVSLINFKLVNEELQQQQQQQIQDSSAGRLQMSSGSVLVEVRQQQQHQQETNLAKLNQELQDSRTAKTTGRVGLKDAGKKMLKQSGIELPTGNKQQQQVCKFQHAAFIPTETSKQTIEPIDHLTNSATNDETNFVVTWRKLSFAIEPKWHQRLLGASQAAGRKWQQQASQQEQTSNAQTNATNGTDCNGATQIASKLVLDKLDGSFRSGELTAILGPSGAGKTTLLDCLTGHKKHGLSGSVRISDASKSSSSSSSSSNSLISGQAQLRAQRNCSFDMEKQQQLQTTTRNENLKVSIIPQNDHLMGHLTVYETLIYASKMKNCFDPKFNHKLNVRRITQQLGLISCLGTRVNKLSGGQYKRVSIAQELLSSPDILILDEPTSGLDAMTCFQTVQVLRKLTDDRQLSGQKQMAVILTIHQPNSDVFQQFNHVYVVAQGGKCIFEGPPAAIESVINRVGIRLPSGGYNPATLVVEVAAGKFGLEAIEKLNLIQKKQYDFLQVPDEQNSTGDSAVDCPSSMSSNDEADDDDDNNNNNNVSKDNNHDLTEINNNNSTVPTDPQQQLGLVNKAFELDDNEGIFADKNVVVVLGKAIGVEIDQQNQKRLASQADCDQPDIAGRRKKRRRARKRSSSARVGSQDGGKQSDSQSNGSSLSIRHTSGKSTGFLGFTAASAGGGGSGGGGGNDPNEPRREKRLKLNSLKADQKFPFWRHTYLHFHRSWLSIVRDPMLCSMQLALHIIVPVMVSLVYGSRVGKPNACPRAGPINIMAYALEPQDSALQLQEDLRTTLENIGYIFFKLYGIIFAAMTVTVLTFPLDMHVLVKEFRNGWYGLSSYFIGRTLADIPFQLTLPFLAMSLSYYATGQPYSYFQWRFLSITGILILSSLIAQSQGLLFGAILMDKMKAAVFVAPAATTPIILFAGFLVRTQSIPRYLRPLSNLSYLRYAIEACLISRYGFNQCECDPAIFNQTVPELPPIARSMLDYWLSSFRSSNLPDNELHSISNGTSLDSIITTTTSQPVSENQPDLFTKLIDSLGKANSFGRNITTCEQVVPYPMMDYDLKDSHLFDCFAILIFMLIFTRLLTFFIVCFKVKKNV